VKDVAVFNCKPRRFEDYTRDETGGARAARSTAGAAGINDERVGNGCQPLSLSIRKLEDAVSAG
jgi:hypothetical protein